MVSIQHPIGLEHDVECEPSLVSGRDKQPNLSEYDLTWKYFGWVPS